MIKTGTRLKSQVCDTEIIVVKTVITLTTCGRRVPMRELGADAATDAVLDPKFADGNVMGKRYVHSARAEVLVTKAGAGTLSVGDVPLSIKEAKPLPASD